MKYTPIIILPLLLLGAPGLVLGEDPLGMVSGTETWKAAGPEDPAHEWREWYQLRVRHRRARAELRLQMARSHRLSVFLRKGGARSRPDMKSVRKVMRARLVSRPKADAPRRGSAGRVTGDGTFLLPGEEAGQVSELQVGKRGRRGKGATPEPPQWVKVPVERLDDSGQAIDDEGDAELERALGQDNPK